MDGSSSLFNTKYVWLVFVLDLLQLQWTRIADILRDTSFYNIIEIVVLRDILARKTFKKI